MIYLFLTECTEQGEIKLVAGGFNKSQSVMDRPIDLRYPGSGMTDHRL